MMLNKLRRTIRKRKVEKKRYADYNKEYDALKKQENELECRFEFTKRHLYPCLNDKTEFTAFDRHYVYHTAWAVRIVKQINPEKHVDISSSLYFSALLSAFIPVDFYDYRPAQLHLDQLRSSSANILALPFDDNTIPSLSCMHTIEHIGLGRYGDELDYNGDIKAIHELKRVLAPEGYLLFVVPLGATDLICFNAHRIYTKQQVLGLFADLSLQEFSLIPEDEREGGLVRNPSQQLLDKQVYGCGCFLFKKTKKADDAF